MGYLIGLRDFIETAELERMQMLADDNPNWFYHIMPYAYVFGLSDVWMKKFEQIAVPAPDWYVNTTGRMDAFDFYLFHRCMMHNLQTVSTTMSVPKPQSSSGSGGSFGGGGFSGGGFSGEASAAEAAAAGRVTPYLQRGQKCRSTAENRLLGGIFIFGQASCF